MPRSSLYFGDNVDERDYGVRRYMSIEILQRAAELRAKQLVRGEYRKVDYD